MMKIDAHAHILPRTWPSLKEKFGYGGFITLEHLASGRANMKRDDGVFFREIEENCWDPKAILVDMDTYNVHTMVLCTVPVLFSYWAQPHDGLWWARFLNDHLAEVVRNHPGRFIGLGTLPMQDATLAVEELIRCKNELGFPGVEIGSNINGKNLDDPTFYPIWEAAEKHHISIFVHPWEMMGANRTADYWGQWLVGMPAETTLAITSMIFGGIFDKFPNLKVMFAHAGGAFPFTVGRISHGYHARPDLCNINTVKDPADYVGKFYVDGITHNIDALKYLINVMGADKIAYGTDYPFPLGDLQHGAFIENEQGLSNDVKARLLAGTVQEFLGL